MRLISQPAHFKKNLNRKVSRISSLIFNRSHQSNKKNPIPNKIWRNIKKIKGKHSQTKIRYLEVMNKLSDQTRLYFKDDYSWQNANNKYQRCLKKKNQINDWIPLPQSHPKRVVIKHWNSTKSITLAMGENPKVQNQDKK